MGAGIGLLLPWENEIQGTGTGIWTLGMGKNVKMGSGICKTYGLGNGIGTPTSGPSNELKNENDSSKSKIKTTSCFVGKHNE